MKRLNRFSAKEIVCELYDGIELQMRHFSGLVDEGSAVRRPRGSSSNSGCSDQIENSRRDARRVLPFHLSAFLMSMSVIWRLLRHIKWTEMSASGFCTVLLYVKPWSWMKQCVIFKRAFHTYMLHKDMRPHIQKVWKKQPGQALKYWKDIGSSSEAMASPRPFNMATKACFASQASSAPAERLFSNLGKRKTISLGLVWKTRWK